MVPVVVFDDVRLVGQESVVTCRSCGVIVTDIEVHELMHFPQRWLLGVAQVDDATWANPGKSMWA